ncbi:sugar transferase [Ornithinimicrobium pratense]|uniref:Sugar transferase n=1 Tax=Ornithinimicrobium pratense TaxID=2593973 RepID=A0A5J6V916_9MICO|nr:sugar transferase [Ornithinimicrobium pratense]
MKRSIDIAVASAGLVATAPLQLAAAAAVRATMGKPVLFRQKRPGLRGHVFEMVKFRSMHHVDDGRGRVADADRLTRVGRALRSTSVDELPTLWNVLRGDMSIVGPRPLLVEYLPLYSPEQARRHEMRPGLTGLAQVSGRNTVSWEDRFRLDVEYIDNWSLRLDFQILARTVAAVLRREGISADGQATMTPFGGSGARSAAHSSNGEE